MQKYISEARLLLALAIPVILAQIAQTAMGFVDTVMAGGYSATDMAAVAIGTSIWLPAILFGHGLLLALTPVIAQLNGSGRRERIAHQVRQGFWLAGFVSVLIMLVLWNAGYIIRSMENIDPALADKAVGYLRALLWGAPGYLFFQVARNQCEGLAKTKPGMVMGFIGLLVNIPVNYIFMVISVCLSSVALVVAWLLRRCIGSCSLPWFLTLNAPAPCAISVTKKAPRNPILRL